MKTKIQLSDHFTHGRLIRFTVPSIGIMLFTSVYSVVDGLFISNYVSKTAFASVNLILFMAVFRLGVAGAALATGLSQCVGGFLPLLWFISKRNTSAIRFTKTKMEFEPVFRACGNGLSEMLSNVSGSITGIFYNRQLMHYAGEDGVAAGLPVCRL